MVRMIIVMLLVFAGLYFYLQEKKDRQADAAAQPKEMVDTAQSAAQATAKEEAATQAQADALRDQAMGKAGADPAN